MLSILKNKMLIVSNRISKMNGHFRHLKMDISLCLSICEIEVLLPYPSGVC